MRYIVLLLALLCAQPLQAATLHAVAAGGNWSDAATWSTTACDNPDSAGVPGFSDDIVIESCAGVVVLDTIALRAKTVTIASGATLSAYNGGIVDSGGHVSLSIVLNSTGTIWSADPGATIDVGASIITLTNNVGGQTITFAGGGHQYGGVHFAQGAGSTFVVTGSNTFTGQVNLVCFPCFSVTTIQFEAISTTTFDDMVVFCPALNCALSSTTPGVQTVFNKTSGIVNINYVAVTDIAISGVATWCNATAGGDGGGNTGWVFAACPNIPQQQLLGVGD